MLIKSFRKIACRRSLKSTGKQRKTLPPAGSRRKREPEALRHVGSNGQFRRHLYQHGRDILDDETAVRLSSVLLEYLPCAIQWDHFATPLSVKYCESYAVALVRLLVGG